jgi:hypothetical protein
MPKNKKTNDSQKKPARILPAATKVEFLWGGLEKVET